MGEQFLVARSGINLTKFVVGQVVRLREWSILYVHADVNSYDEVCELERGEMMLVIGFDFEADERDPDLDCMHVNVYVPRRNVVGWITDESQLGEA